MAEEFGEGSELTDVDDELFAEVSARVVPADVAWVVESSDTNMDFIRKPDGYLVIMDDIMQPEGGVNTKPRSDELKRQ